MSTIDHTDPKMADFLNRSPVVFAGLTHREVIGCGIASFVIGLSTGLLFGLMFSHVTAGSLFFTVASVATMLSLASFLRKNKQSKPVGYLEERIHRLRVGLGLGGSDLILRSGRWSRGRSI